MNLNNDGRAEKRFDIGLSNKTLDLDGHNERTKFWRLSKVMESSLQIVGIFVVRDLDCRDSGKERPTAMDSELNGSRKGELWWGGTTGKTSFRVWEEGREVEVKRFEGKGTMNEGSVERKEEVSWRLSSLIRKLT